MNNVIKYFYYNFAMILLYKFLCCIYLYLSKIETLYDINV